MQPHVACLVIWGALCYYELFNSTDCWRRRYILAIFIRYPRFPVRYQALFFRSHGYEFSECKVIGRADGLILPFATIAALLWCSPELSK